MNSHLDDREITDAVAGLELEAASAEHLGACLSCRQRVSAIRELIEERHAQLEDEAPDWDRQRREIMSRLPAAAAQHASRRRAWTRPLLAVAAIVIAAIGLRALWTPAPPAEPAAGAELPVEQILAEVDAVLADDSIPGFEVIDPGLEEAIYENGTS